MVPPFARPGLRRILPAGLCWALGLLLGCEPTTPPLLRVHDISPSEAEAMDHVVVRGEGFPEGAEAVVELDGDVFAAESLDRHDISLELHGVSESSERVSVQLTEDAARKLLGGSDSLNTHAAHVTFRGLVRVAFVPRVEGAPPISGEASAELDVFGPDRGSAPDDDELDAFLGAELQTVPHGEGVRVQRVAADGRLGVAGLRSGDSVTRWGGLNVKSARDMRPAPGARLVELTVVRPQLEVAFETTVDVAGFAPQPAGGWALGLGVMIALAIGLLLSRGQASRAIAFTLGRIASASAHRTGAIGVPASAVPAVPRRGTHGLGAFLGVSALFAAVTHRAAPWDSDFDLVVVVACGAIATWLAQFIEGASRSGNWSVLRGLLSITRGLTAPLAGMLCLMSYVVHSGSLAFVTPGESDGSLLRALPLFDSPGTYLAGLALVGCIALPAMGCAPDRASPLAKSAHTSLSLAASLIWAGIALGPFAGVLRQGTTLWSPTSLPHGIAFQAGLTLAYTLCLALSRSIQCPAPHVRRLYTRYVLPLALLGLVTTMVWDAPAWPQWLRDSLIRAEWVLTALLLAIVAASAVSVRRTHARPSSVNPWL